MRIGVLGAVCAIVVVCWSSRDSRADAPYDVYAVYDHDGADTPMLVTDGMMIPDVGDGWKLKAIRIAFHRAGLGQNTPAVFRNFSVRASGGDPISVEAADIAPTKDVDVLKWTDDVGDGRRTAQISIDIRGKFSAEFLCSQELLYRQENGKQRVLPPKGPKTPWFADASVAPQYVLPVSTRKDEGELIYSFCATYADNDLWDERVKTLKEDASTLKAEQKKILFDRMKKDGAFSKFSTQYADDLVLGADGPGYNSDVYISDKMSFKVVRLGDLFTLHEMATDKVRDVSSLVDQASTLVVSAKSEKGVCPPIRSTPFSYQLKEDGSDPKQLAIDFRDKCAAALTVALKDHLDRIVTFSVLYGFPDAAKTQIVLYKSQFRVANLGLITTFPIITEVNTAITKPSLRDVEATSSIPVSFAIPLTGRGNTALAVTFPWKLSFNTRTAPDLANYFSVYAHISVIASTDTSSDLRPALGVGFAIAQVFSVSWAATFAVGDTAQHYLLLGLSVPDLAKLFAARP